MLVSGPQFDSMYGVAGRGMRSGVIELGNARGRGGPGGNPGSDRGEPRRRGKLLRGVAVARPLCHALGVVVERLADSGVLSSEASFRPRGPGSAVVEGPLRLSTSPLRAETASRSSARHAAP